MTPEAQMNSTFMEESKLTPAGVVLCLALVSTVFVSSAVVGAYNVGRRQIAGEVAIQMLVLQQATDSALSAATELRRALAEVEKEFAAAHRPRISLLPMNSPKTP